MAKTIPQLNEPTLPLKGTVLLEGAEDNTSSIKISVTQLGDKVLSPMNPYIDATAGLSVTLGMVNGLSYVDWNQSAVMPDWQEGRLFWDKVNKTITIYNEISDVALQLGQETFIRVKNDTVTQLDNGEVVYVSGASAEGFPTIELSQANDHLKVYNVGICTHDIPAGTIGYITVRGVVRDIDTSIWDEGDALYVSHTTPGALINTTPPAPYEVAPVATVIDKGLQGSILVNPGHHGGLDELSNVDVSDADPDNSILVWDFSTKIWNSSHIISINGTLSGNSDINVPTEKAVKTYVDSKGWNYESIVATTSGTSITLASSLPDDITEIEVILNGISTSANQANPIIRLGDAGGVETTGYLGGIATRSGSSGVTDGYYCFRPNDFQETDEICGTMHLRRWDPSLHQWMASGIFDDNGDGDVSYYSGKKTTSGVLTTIVLTTSGGTATFDAGSARVRYR